MLTSAATGKDRRGEGYGLNGAHGSCQHRKVDNIGTSLSGLHPSVLQKKPCEVLLSDAQQPTVWIGKVLVVITTCAR